MKEYIKKLKVLGDETRVRILRLLASVDWLYVCEIVETLELPFYSISRHLKELENANLIEQKREGKFIRYFLNKNESFNSKIIDLLTSIKSNSFDVDDERLKKVVANRDSLNCKLSSKDKKERV
ncbi:MAG: ArsR/SmtB family transcription factor [Brevinematia bacterium]